MSTQAMGEKAISIVDFSRNPSGRFPKDGPDNGETFRKKFLVPAFKDFDRVAIILDGASGFPSSFLDEAFGGLVRAEGLSGAELHQRLSVKCSEAELDRYVPLIWRYIDRSANMNTKPS